MNALKVNAEKNYKSTPETDTDNNITTSMEGNQNKMKATALH